MSGIDTTNWQSWQQIKTPSGGVYYQVPNSGLVYDPILSQSKGQNVFHPNPQPGLDEQKRQREAQSPINQLYPVAGAIAGPVGAGYLLNQLKDTAPAVVTPLAETAGNAVATTAAAPTVSGAATAPGMLGSISDSISSASGFINGAMGGNVGPVMNGAEYAGSLSGAAPGGVSGALGNVGGVGVLPVLGGALGAYGLYTGLQDGKKNPLMGAASGAALGASVGGPWGALIGAGVGGLAEFFGTHKKTKQYQAERWGGLQKDGVIGAGQAAALNHPDGDTGVWSSGKYAGQKWSFDKAKDLASEDPTHFQHVYGNYKTFGNDWNSYDDAKQKQIVSALVQNNLYKGDKGDVVITDTQKAREIKDQVLGGTYGKAPEPNVGVQLAQRMNDKVKRK